jgi:hypothetical protein
VGPEHHHHHHHHVAQQAALPGHDIGQQLAGDHLEQQQYAQQVCIPPPHLLLRAGFSCAP